MKKSFKLFFLLIFLSGCNNNVDQSSLTIPIKLDMYDNDVLSSPINTSNLDNYMFLEDVQYVDLRSFKMILTEGYVSGFSFIPFYNIIASFTSDKTLFKMVNYDINDKTKVSTPGQVGTFVANYLESEEQIKYYFNQDKYIFFISQGGSEASYMINLLTQIGYDPSKLYNVGGVSNNEGREPYKSIKTNKYYVAPGVSDINITFDYSFIEKLTPITKEGN